MEHQKKMTEFTVSSAAVWSILALGCLPLFVHLKTQLNSPIAWLAYFSLLSVPIPHGGYLYFCSDYNYEIYVILIHISHRMEIEKKNISHDLGGKGQIKKKQRGRKIEAKYGVD